MDTGISKGEVNIPKRWTGIKPETPNCGHKKSDSFAIIVHNLERTERQHNYGREEV